MPKQKGIIVSGYFNPLHKGHIEYINSAKSLGDPSQSTFSMVGLLLKMLFLKLLELKGLELLEFLGLKDRINNKPNELSGGEQQRVAVARALINNPSIVFADEPSGNLDKKSAKQLHKLFFELRDRFGQTFVIVTHNNELADMADRKIIMSDGLVKLL